MTAEDFVDQALQLVKANLDPRTHQITLALIGDGLKKLGLEKGWKQLGHRTLLSFFESLQAQGRVELVKTPKGALAVQLGLGEGAPSAAQAPARFVPLLRSIWVAFVLSTPSGRRYISQDTGEVRVGLQEPPSIGGHWVEIAPIPDGTQRDWARTFLEENAVSNLHEVETALASPVWHRDFPEALRSSSPELRSRWNRVRSLRISAIVERWGIENNVPREHLFQMQAPQRDVGNDPCRAPVVMQQEDPLERRRELILRALASLPTERLLEIPIPAAALFDAIDASTATQK